MNKIFGYIVMLFIAIISVVPLIWVFLSSFKTNNEVLESAYSWPSSFSFVSYVDALKLSKLHLYFFNSIFISVTSTIMALIIFGMAGYVLARVQFKFRNVIFIILTFSMLVPTNSTIQPIYTIINSLHMYDKKIGLIIVYIAFGLPLCLFLLKSFYSSLPRELEESAYIEGAGFIGTYVRIILPMSMPAIASSGVLLFLGSWNEFLFALLLTSSPSNRTISLSLNYLMSTFSYDYPALFAALIMTILPSIVIYVILQEQITKSLIVGAVKE